MTNGDLLKRLDNNGRRYLVHYGYVRGELNEESLRPALELFRRSLLEPGFDAGLDTDAFWLAFQEKTVQNRCNFPDYDAGEPIGVRSADEIATRINKIIGEFRGAQLEREQWREGGRDSPPNLRLAYPIPLRYRVDGPAPSGESRQSVEQTLAIAFSSQEGWASITLDGQLGSPKIIEFTRVSCGPAEIKVSWGPIDGAGGAIGNGSLLGTREDQGIVRFDEKDPWSAALSDNTFHIRTVGLHEIGHTLGLGHIFDVNPTPIMNPDFQLGTPRTMLQRADILEFLKIRW